MNDGNKIYDAYVSDEEPTSREETLKVLREMVPKSSRKLKERVFLLDFDDIDSLLTIWIYESGHYTDCLITKKNTCEICQIILDYDELLGNDLN